MTVEEDIELFRQSKKNSDYFLDQLMLIKDKDLRNAVADILDTVVPRFEIERATSSTGKYHSVNQNMEAGNGRHTKCLIKFMLVFARARPDLNWDCLFSAGILHDMAKYDSEDSKYTNNEHPLIMSNKILNFAEDNYGRKFSLNFKKALRNRKIRNKLEYVASLVRWHSGRFDSANSDKNQISIEYMDRALKNLPNEEHWIMHYCDMLAAAKWIGTEETF